MGLDYTFLKYLMDMFVEAAAIVDITPNVECDFNGGLGIRYFF
ncbi:MAG: hypothetical protein ACMUJM_18920 [bacterium]